MKKLFKLIIIALFLSAGKSEADNFIVSGASNTNENGTYVESGTYNSKPYYVLSSYYYISWSGAEWELGQGCCGGNVFLADCTDSSTSSTCPTSDWSCLNITVAPEPDNLSYSTNKFIESIANDGSFPSSVRINLNDVSNGQAFTGHNGDDYAGNKMIFGTLPAGLTPHAILTDSFITLTFTGSATNNSPTDDSWLTFQFADSAFANDTASAVLNSVDSVHLLFRNVLTVASSGADFTTVAGALDSADDYDIISISGETFTEAGLAVNKAVTFIGQAANQTIIQADTSYNMAADRVFTVSASDTVEFRDMTIRYGKVTSGNGEGGAIYSVSTPVNVVSCAVTDNIASSTGSAYGGAIYCHAPLKIVASLVANNAAISTTNCWGGAISCVQLYMVNSTLSGDTITAATTSYGTAIYSIHGPVSIINCTIAGNISTDGAAVTADETNFDLTNTIVYGNTGGDDVQTLNGTAFNAYDCIMGAGSTAAINGTNYNVSTLDPLLSPLADNGGPTETMALNAGSFAIDEGATGDSIPTTDQRGYAAVGIRDIGAYEYGGFATGIKSLNSVNTMAVYPNPANDFINVVRSSEVSSIYTVTDLLGQTVLTGMLTARNTVINTNSLSAGVYIFKAGSEQCKLLKE